MLRGLHRVFMQAGVMVDGTTYTHSAISSSHGASIGTLMAG